jgi:hypothetical protein
MARTTTIAKSMQRILESLRRPQIAFAIILLFGMLAMTARNATDPDLWWHLRARRWIVEAGHDLALSSVTSSKGAAYTSHADLR